MQPMQQPPPPGYAPMPPPMVAAPLPDPFLLHNGLVFEANIGVGFARASGDGTSSNSNAALAGLDVGLGGWLTPRLALTARISGVDIANSGDDTNAGTVVAAFFGPSLQYWIDPHFWIGGGLGLATFRAISGCDSSGTTDQCGVNGFGLDLRAGYSFGTSQHSFNISAEITPGFYSLTTDDGTGTGTTTSQSISVTGVAFLVGYQYL